MSLVRLVRLVCLVLFSLVFTYCSQPLPNRQSTIDSGLESQNETSGSPEGDSGGSTNVSGSSSDEICTLLKPFAVEAPDTVLIPSINHPQEPAIEVEGDAPIPTNHFMGNFVVSSGSNPTFAHPYVLKMKTDSPYGVSISHSDTKVMGGSGSDGAAQFYFNVFEEDIGFSAKEAVELLSIQDYDETSFTVLFQAGEGTMTLPIVRGMAYVTAEYDGASPIIYSQHALIRVNEVQGSALGNSQLSGKRFELEFNNGDIWILYVMGNNALEFEVQDGKLVGLSSIRATLRLTKLPVSIDGARELLDIHSSAIPIGSELSAAMHETSPNKASYSFQWKTSGEGDLLHYALPHHLAVLSSDVTRTELQLASTTKGIMSAVIGNRWTLREPHLTTLEWMPPRNPSAEHQTIIEQALIEDISDEFGVNSDSYYFAGKSLYKRALLCLMANQMGLNSLRVQCVAKLKEAMQPFVSNTHQHPLRYDDTWGGIVSEAGLGGNALTDFGNSYYNDHHYHWGYYVQTAAILRLLDPAWGEAKNDWVTLLLRDVANPSSDDPYFPMFRSFDWFMGHSWSQGLFASADGKDQESTSEEVNFHYGMYLWGLASGNSRVANLGRLMLAAASRSINTYFLLRDDNTIHPPEFIANKVTGIFFENKCDYATWFGANKEFIHGIQMIPATPITEEVRFSDFIEEEWGILSGLAPGLNSGWKSLLYMNYASLDSSAAFDTLRDSPLDDGVTRSWALYYAATRPEPGTIIPPPPPTDESGYRDWMAVECVD